MYYPVFLDVRGKKCLVIGSGEEARKKAQSLREAGAKVKKVPGTLGTRYLKYLVPFLSPYFLVVSASYDSRLNKRVFSACTRMNKLMNVVDVPKLSNFIYPSRFQRGPLQIAVSTGGASPVLARHIRKTLEKKYGHAWSKFLVFLAEQRKQVLKKVTDRKVRRRLLTQAGSREIAGLLEKGKFVEAKKRVKKILERL